MRTTRFGDGIRPGGQRRKALDLLCAHVVLPGRHLQHLAQAEVAELGVGGDLIEISGEQVVQEVAKAAVRDLEGHRPLTRGAIAGAGQARRLRQVEGACGETPVVEVDVVDRAFEGVADRLPIVGLGLEGGGGLGCFKGGDQRGLGGIQAAQDVLPGWSLRSAAADWLRSSHPFLSQEASLKHSRC